MAICKADDCTKQSNFGLVNDKRASYCKPHALEGMVDIVNKKCKADDCTTQPYFGLLNDKRASYCKPHALEGMVDIKSKKCKYTDCTKGPSFGLLNDKQASYCKSHALEGMVDIVSKKCKADDCTKGPSYGLSDNKRASYCKSHALEGMVDIVSKKCKYTDCTKGPSYGLLNDKRPSYCKSHALEGMINIVSKRCKADECTTRPSYGLVNDKRPSYCKSHALTDMIDIVNKRCKTCLSITMNSKYKPNCSRCHFYLNPDDPRIRNYKTKEHAFMLPLKELYPDILLDKRIDGGCSKRRPDGLLDISTHSIVIEIDENQHISYDNECDNRRTMEIFRDLGSRPLIYIRLNPDSYKSNEKNHKGCFSMSKTTRELKVTKKEFTKRFSSLKDAISLNINNVPTRNISYVHLYYTN